jgi:hypothetical protein
MGSKCQLVHKTCLQEAPAVTPIWVFVFSQRQDCRSKFQSPRRPNVGSSHFKHKLQFRNIVKSVGHFPFPCLNNTLFRSTNIFARENRGNLHKKKSWHKKSSIWVSAGVYHYADCANMQIVVTASQINPYMGFKSPPSIRFLSLFLLNKTQCIH